MCMYPVCYAIAAGLITAPILMQTPVTIACDEWRQWVVPGEPEIVSPVFNYKFQYKLNDSHP